MEMRTAAVNKWWFRPSLLLLVLVLVLAWSSDFSVGTSIPVAIDGLEDTSSSKSSSSTCYGSDWASRENQSNLLYAAHQQEGFLVFGFNGIVSRFNYVVFIVFCFETFQILVESRLCHKSLMHLKYSSTSVLLVDVRFNPYVGNGFIGTTLGSNAL